MKDQIFHNPQSRIIGEGFVLVPYRPIFVIIHRYEKVMTGRSQSS